jgi:hypothetical protein
MAGCAVGCLALAGCAVGGSGTSPAAPPRSAAAPPGAPPPTAPTDAGAGRPSLYASVRRVGTTGLASPATAVLIEFDRRGGIAGVVDRLEVRRDGGFTLFRARPSVNRTGRLTAAELSDLHRKIDASGFATLPGVERAPGNDLFVYHLTYGGWQILAQDGGIAAPLQPVISALSALVQEYGA